MSKKVAEMENINVCFEENLQQQQILLKYTEALQELRTLAAKKYLVDPDYFDQYVQLKYLERENEDSGSRNAIKNIKTASVVAFIKQEFIACVLGKRRQIAFICIFFIACMFLYRKEFIPDNNSPTITHRSLRLWRRLTLPIIKKFPQLTELYDESCLMENPFFQAEVLSCDVCAKVERVVDLTEQNQQKIATINVPYIIKITQDPVQLHDLHNVYRQHKHIFDRDAFRVSSSDDKITNLEELFINYNNSASEAHETHSLWRCNRMLPARLIRQVFTQPILLPETSLALERFVSVDTSHADAYILPQTECSNVYVQQALGTRLIILRPTITCRDQCRSLSVRLSQSYALGYNWLHWKPISVPDPIADTPSISLISSFC